MSSNEEPKKVEETVLSKTAAPVLLAFLSGWYDIVCFKQYKAYALMPTGNYVNAFMQIGNGDYSNTKFLLLATFAQYTGGMTLYKFLDLVTKGLSPTNAAKVVFALHAAADQLRLMFPESRFTLAPLSISGGFFNSFSGGKLGGIMAMMNGHFQGLGNAFGELAHKGHTPALQTTIIKHLRILAAFALGLFAGCKKGNFTANRRFTMIGAIYAAILVLHDTPKSALGM